MHAVVLARGLGTRLRSAVPDLPKPMAPVAGRPFLCWILDRLVDAGFVRAVLAVGYRHEVVPGICELCRRAGALGLRLVVVTHQAGIARGYDTEADFERPTRWMVDAFGERGITSGGGSAPPAGPT